MYKYAIYVGGYIYDHLAKSFTSILKDASRGSYEKYVHEEQCGCMRGRGTEFATHIVRSFIDYCSMGDLCFLVLFVDLEKAFDKVIREFLLGFPSTCTQDPLEYILSLGLPIKAATDLVFDILSNGPFLEQIGVPHVIVTLITSMHSCSWFSYGTLKSAIVTRTGGRQGCKLGDLILNFVYERALQDVGHALSLKGHVLQLPSSDEVPFWVRPCALNHQQPVDVFDATYVDDEAVFVCLVT